ncbi:sigma factor [Streptomyces venezuelae]|uniref:sigma factor n=1 Tax=Streptomyces venezuelae TaxID=54571 RepID=UPI0037ABA134
MAEATAVSEHADTSDPFEQHWQLLFGISYRMLGTVADAEDVVQETWLRRQRLDRDVVADPRGHLVRAVHPHLHRRDAPQPSPAGRVRGALAARTTAGLVRRRCTRSSGSASPRSPRRPNVPNRPYGNSAAGPAPCADAGPALRPGPSAGP